MGFGSAKLCASELIGPLTWSDFLVSNVGMYQDVDLAAELESAEAFERQGRL